MKYHTADPRWSIFGMDSFESYCEKVVLEGKFHECVPQDIKDDYLSVEHMMAQAYHHYPLYHEAFSKVLRIIEMAVKIRCQQLNIPLDVTLNNGQVRKKVLKTLMDESVAAEPGKQLRQKFEVARSLRNSLMHPDRHIYSGAMSRSFIMHAVTLLNTLFLPEENFATYRDELGIMQGKLSLFKQHLLIFEASGQKFLVTGINVEAAVPINDVLHYLLVGYPILLNAQENLTNHSYIKPLTVFVDSIAIYDDKIVAGLGVDDIVVIRQTDHPLNVATHEKFVEELNRVSEVDRQMYELHLDHEIGEVETKFWYEKLWKVEG